MKNTQLPEKKQRALMINILNDAVILCTLANSIKAINDYADIDMYYNGFSNAVALLDLPEPRNEEEEELLQPTNEMLQMIFMDAVENNCRKLRADRTIPERLAERILEEWEGYLNKSTININLIKQTL